MPRVLKLAQLGQHHDVPEMDVGCRRVDSQLHAQGAVARELLRQAALRQRLDGPLQEACGVAWNR